MLKCLSYFLGIIVTCVALSAAGAENEGGKWAVQHRRAILMLAYKQTASIDNKTRTSGLAFLCDQNNKFGVVGAMLVPFDGTFDSDQAPIPLLILRQADDVERSDLPQTWRNASDFLFTDSSEDLADLVALLMDKSTDADTSVHLRFPGSDNGQLRSNHIVVDADGFARQFAAFENECTSGH
jgi:hypothetical protein